MEPNQAKYEKISRYIKEKVMSGEWPVGSKIPSQRKLAEQFGVNRSTIITSLEELKAAGLLEGVMGKGTIVVNNTWTLLATSPPEDWKESRAQPFSHSEGIEADGHNSGDFIQLSKGELAQDIFPKDNMQQVMMRLAGTIEPFGYEEPKGYLPLREAISDYMKGLGVSLSPSSILIVSGAIQGLQLISAGLLHRGSSVLLEQPSYLYSLQVFQSAGMSLCGLPMDQNGLIPDSIFKKHQKTHPSIVYTIPCYHNPTGLLLTKERRQALLDVCETLQLPIIEDDIYRELWIDAPPPPPLKSLDKHGNVLYLGSFSKTLSPGLRIGWIAGPEPVIERLAEVKMQTDYGSSSLSQMVAAEWMTSGLYSQHLAFVREQLKKRRSSALAALQRYMSDLAEWEVPAGGFLIWLKLKAKVQVKELYEKALQKGIQLSPGSIYTEESAPAIRLSYGYASPEEFTEGLKQLRKIILENS
nr:PLP-dependent aminotransferase family protein [Bacillus xiapuensis]